MIMMASLCKCVCPRWTSASPKVNPAGPAASWQMPNYPSDTMKGIQALVSGARAVLEAPAGALALSGKLSPWDTAARS